MSQIQLEKPGAEETELLLQYRLKAGDLWKYLLEMGSEHETPEEGRTAGLVELLLIQAVLSSDPDEIVCESTIIGAQLLEGELTEPLPSLGNSAQLRMKPTGLVLGSPEPGPPQVVFPETAVRLGESWKRVAVLDFAPGLEADPESRPSVEYTCTLSGFEELGGYRAAVVDLECPETTFEVSSGVRQHTTVRGRMHFAWKEGLLLHSETITTHRVCEVSSRLLVRLGLVTDG